MEMKKILVLILVLTMVLVDLAGQDCDSDTQPPRAVSFFGVLPKLDPVNPPTDLDGDGIVDHYSAVVQAQEAFFHANGATEDNCSTELQYRIEVIGEQGFGQRTTSLLVTEHMPRQSRIRLWVGDEAENWSFCETFLWVPEDPSCPHDSYPPSAVCKSLVEVALHSSVAVVEASLLDDGSVDPCAGELAFSISLDPWDEAPPAQLEFSEIGTFLVNLWVTNEIGDFSRCQTYLRVTDGSNMEEDCAQDVTAPIAICPPNVLVYYPNSTFPDVEIQAEMLAAQSYDNCTADLQYRVEFSPPSPVPPPTTSLTLGQSDLNLEHEILFVWAIDEAGNSSFCEANVRVENNFIGHQFQGTVFIDNGNCLREEEDMAVAGISVQASVNVNGVPRLVETTETGGEASNNYDFVLKEYENGAIGFGREETISVGAEDLVEIELQLVEGINSACTSSYLISEITLGTSSSYLRDFGIVGESDCAELYVDITTPFLRRCFGAQYWINYCNYGRVTAEGVTIRLSLDEAMEFIDSDILPTSVEGQELVFHIGSLPPGGCGRFPVQVQLGCENTVLGQTHCTEVEASHQNVCFGASSYNGPELQLDAKCRQDQVEFTIRNIGADMTVGHKYIVIEDILMLQQGTTDILSSGQGQVFSLPANGSTFRLEVDQAPDYPFAKVASVAIEGCGENQNGEVSQGFINQFPENDQQLALAIDCQQNIGSYDPNDKQAFPRGVGEDKLVKPNVPVEYLVRFQNTGTDTAFTVRIQDQLSDWLDITTVKPGASSHPYSFSIKENRLLEFRFNNILLPDSTTNLAASNGFVKFRVEQKKDNPSGAYIKNTADIYFDFNEAIQTNVVTHLVGEITLTNAQAPRYRPIKAQIIPNPFAKVAALYLDGEVSFPVELQLFDSMGRLVRTELVKSNRHEVERAVLPQGIYFYTLTDRNGKLGTGKLMAK